MCPTATVLLRSDLALVSQKTVHLVHYGQEAYPLLPGSRATLTGILVLPSQHTNSVGGALTKTMLTGRSCALSSPAPSRTSARIDQTKTSRGQAKASAGIALPSVPIAVLTSDCHRPIHFAPRDTRPYRPAQYLNGFDDDRLGGLPGSLQNPHDRRLRRAGTVIAFFRDVPLIAGGECL